MPKVSSESIVLRLFLVSFLLLLAQFINSGHATHSPSTSLSKTHSDKTQRLATSHQEKGSTSMGQAMRMVQYDRAANERAAIPVLKMAGHGLHWFRLDDGVMGGKSGTEHQTADDGSLHFCGTINTDGGGFASIRSKISEGLLSNASGVRMRIKGDGKTYKFLLSQGRSAGSPMSSTPSWQADVPTAANGEWQEVQIDFDTLQPSFGGGFRGNRNETYTFDASTMKEMGLMLSLKLSNGSPNPPATFGEGIFPFSLHISSLEPIVSDKTCSN